MDKPRTMPLNRRHAAAVVGAAALAPWLRPAHAAAPTGEHGLAPVSEKELLDDLELRSFKYFWETTDARTGLVPDRWPTHTFASIAAVGFALTAYPIGVQRGWITRAQAAERALNTLRFFHDAPQGPKSRGTAGHKGFFYHFIDMGSGLRYDHCELSTVDTALLVAGALHCQSFFDRNDAQESRIRVLAEELAAGVDWRWSQDRRMAVRKGWHPETGFIREDWTGYNEAMLIYVLALGSPATKHALDERAWKAWTSTYDKDWGSRFGQPHLRFSPLFGHQFSHIWIDFRGLRDAYMAMRGFDYFENSRRATLEQRAYAQANPLGWAAYGGDVWGITACDGPADTYRVYGGRVRRFISYGGRGMDAYDDGTIAPYGAGSSIVFTPRESVAALASMRERWGKEIYGRYGYFAFNPSFYYPEVRLKHGRLVTGMGWVNTDFLGIEVGPQLAMLANHRGELVWSAMRRNAHMRRGLQRAGFTGDWLG